MLSLFWLHLVYNGWLDSSQNRDSKCLRINFRSAYNKPWAPSLTCFHSPCFLHPTCFLNSSLFDSYSPFLKLKLFYYHLVDLEHYAFYEISGELLSIINDNTLDIFAINRLSFVEKCEPLSGISDHHVIVTMCLQYQKPTPGKIYYGTKLTLVILEMNLNTFMSNS